MSAQQQAGLGHSLPRKRHQRSAGEVDCLQLVESTACLHIMHGCSASWKATQMQVGLLTFCHLRCMLHAYCCKYLPEIIGHHQVCMWHCCCKLVFAMASMHAAQILSGNETVFPQVCHPDLRAYAGGARGHHTSAAANAPPHQPPAWLGLLNEALRPDLKDWRRTMQCIDGALACASPDMQSQGLSVCHELERAKGVCMCNQVCELESNQV